MEREEQLFTIQSLAQKVAVKDINSVQIKKILHNAHNFYCKMALKSTFLISKKTLQCMYQCHLME